MKDEARIILRDVLSAEAIDAGRGSAIRALLRPFGGRDLPAIDQEPMREPPA